MESVENRLATPTTRRRGRPTTEEVAARMPPVPAAIDRDSGRIKCTRCGRPTLVVASGPRKSDGGTPHRCTACGHRVVRIVLLSEV